MTVVMKLSKVIFLKIPAVVLFAVVFTLRRLFGLLSGAVAIIFRIVGALVLLISVLSVIFGLSDLNKMIWPAIGGTVLFFIPMIRSWILLFLDSMTEGLKSIIMLR